MYIHDRLALEPSRCLEETNIPKLMTKGKTTLTQINNMKKEFQWLDKDLEGDILLGERQPWSRKTPKGTIPSNYTPITCLIVMWKILTALVWEEINDTLLCCRLFPEEQEGFHRGTGGTNGTLIDTFSRGPKQGRKSSHGMDWFKKRPMICSHNPR